MKEKQILGTYNNFEVYKIGVLYYYYINGNEFCFTPYVVCDEKQYKKKNIIYDINDFVEACKNYTCDDFINRILDIIKKSHEEDIKSVWEKIDYIKQLKISQDDKDEKKNTKPKKRKRLLKIPLNEVKDLKFICLDEIIVNINYYTTKLNNHEYIIDIYKTDKNNFYVTLVDITNGYQEINIDQLKKKTNIQLSFDFFNI